MASENKDVLESIDSSNIFDEFETGELTKELENKKNKKDMYDYLSIIWSAMSTVFWFALIIAVIGFAYTHYQSNEQRENSSLLAPICFLFTWDTPSIIDNTCTSIVALNKHYEELINTTKSQQFEKINALLEEVYKIENFNKSKEVIFLTSQTQNKVPITEILTDFDNLLYEYDSSKLNQIQCKDISVNDSMIVNMNCSTYTWDFDRSIRWMSGNEKINGTSITLATSFLHYIENNSDSFIIQDKQRTFKKDPYYSDENIYTSETKFELKMQYIPSNNLNTK